MTSGTIVMSVNGVRSTVTIPCIEGATAATLNQAFHLAGAEVTARTSTAADEALWARQRAKLAAQTRQRRLDALALEEPAEVQATLKRLGYSRGPLAGLSDKALARVAECFEPDSY